MFGYFCDLLALVDVQGTNWDDLLHKRVEPPFKPTVVSYSSSLLFSLPRGSSVSRDTLLCSGRVSM